MLTILRMLILSKVDKKTKKTRQRIHHYIESYYNIMLHLEEKKRHQNGHMDNLSFETTKYFKSFKVVLLETYYS